MSEQNNPKPKNHATGIKVLIFAVVLVLVIVLLASCLIRGCARKIGEVFQDQDAFFLGNDTSDYAGNYYDGGAPSNVGKLDSTVADAARAKRTKIKGGGKDVVTVMVYVCGSDLEANGGAATMDIQEMLDAGISDNVNLILYTGGTTKWQNRQMSSNVNQVYQVSGSDLYLLKENAGSKSMTEPETLSEFIRYCAKHFPANRNMLILWDHGGGSVAGYGSDENFSYTGPMTLGGLGKALKKGGVSFDFVGFDACLMATVENGLMLDKFADYMIASEETESGYGWYYTDWLRSLSENTSLPTIEIGKQIADDFITDSARRGQNYMGTLSVVDLAELSQTVPEPLGTFAEEITACVEGTTNTGDYKTIAKARASAREFGPSHKIDQVDLIDFAEQLNTTASGELSRALKSAVKYNNTTDDMSGSYGLSVYFPYANASYVNMAGELYQSIGMPSAYTRCVESYAAMELSGQYVSGGTGDPFNSLFGLFGSGDYGDSTYYGNSTGSSYSEDVIDGLLNELLGGDTGGFSDEYDADDFSFFRDSLDVEMASKYISENQFDETDLEWQENDEGTPVIKLTEDQWDLVESIELNMFYDDGEGYIDLGSDNVFSFDKDGNLEGKNTHTWLSIDGHYMSYYYDNMTQNEAGYVINGHAPILLNGEDADLLLRFDKEHPYGVISGVCYSTKTKSKANNVGKTLCEVLSEHADFQEEAGTGVTGEDTGLETTSVLKEGDKVEFLADFYDYKGNFKDQFVLDEPWIVSGQEPEIANIDLGEGPSLAMFCFTDVYHKQYWTGVIPE